eukprot:TRINITY_DN21834_c0_g1_i1.p1 TRINITY_DN21834_c0_g1~~TRINITY_DN21834_c0_g1_i1.p1  ORF type:complete len:184 (+),score=29.62 TRINITY_DN21834_c0_g1_i1:43-552(+)
MGCSQSQEEKKVKHAPAKRGVGGFGAPTESKNPTQLPTGIIDEGAWNSLPPCDMADEVLSLHPSKGGPNEGIVILSNLYQAIHFLNERGRQDKGTRKLQTSLIQSNGSVPKAAMEIAEYVGFSQVPNKPEKLLAEDPVTGAYVSKLSSTEIRVLLDYIEATIGGVPPLQ